MKKTLLVMALASTATYTAWRWTRAEAPARAQDSQLALDRVWIDHLPTTDRDTVQVFVALTAQPVGLFQKGSQWQGAYEVFRYEAHGDQLRVLYPQSGERETVKAVARPCTDAHMDYCLDLDGASRGARRYYSLEGWEIEGARTVEDLKRRADAIVDQLTR